MSAERNTRGGADGPSRQLLEAVSPTLFSCRAVGSAVSGDDVGRLRKLVKAGQTPGFPFDLRRALRSLALSDKSEAAASVIHDIARNSSQPGATRYDAVAALGTYPPEAAEEHLLDFVRSEETRIQLLAIRSLATAGSSRGLVELGRLKVTEEASRRRLAEARLAIAHRIGAPPEEIARAREQLGLGGRRVLVRRLEAGEAARIVRGLPSDLAQTLHTDLGLEIGAAPAAHQVLLSARLPRGRFVEGLSSAGMVAGVVVADELRTGRPAVKYHVLTSPEGQALHVVVTTPAGRPVYSGEGPIGETLRVVLHDIGRSASRKAITVHVQPGEIELQVVTFEATGTSRTGRALK